jgi:Domain of unknown function (DUF3846)
MATILRVEGTSEVLTPPNGYWQLAELQTMVGGYIEIVRTVDGRFLVIDEEGKLKKKPLNIEATKLYLYGRHDPICGTAVLVNTREEMDEPEDEDEEVTSDT